ncbi:MAG: nucleotidyltransferase [Bacilli bacterium]|nr:nucleotidyltransferase [Bacilli bacterium]
MDAVGIIAEYNPFHNGHLYHLNKVKEMFPDSATIIILGGNFMQRGEPSIINKWDKTKIALEYGVDLVVELPFCFATQSGDIFARGGIQLLEHLKVKHLVFGSESDDIKSLTKLAKEYLKNENNNIIKDCLDKGYNYPSALSKGLNNKIKSPNDILGLCYIKEIMKGNYNIIPITIKRTSNYHNLELTNNIVSASSIRNALKNNEDVKNYVPDITYKYLHNTLHFKEDYFNLLKYKILANINYLDKFQTVDEGIENRIKKVIVGSTSLEDLINKIKSKRYTHNRIMRMLTHILTDFTKEEAQTKKNIEYIRILGFSDKGKDYLNKIKKDINIPIISKYSKTDDKLLSLELRTTSIYASILNEEDKIKLIEAEYKNKPIKK